MVQNVSRLSLDSSEACAGIVPGGEEDDLNGHEQHLEVAGQAGYGSFDQDGRITVTVAVLLLWRLWSQEAPLVWLMQHIQDPEKDERWGEPRVQIVTYL